MYKKIKYLKLNKLLNTNDFVFNYKHYTHFKFKNAGIIICNKAEQSKLFIPNELIVYLEY